MPKKLFPQLAIIALLLAPHRAMAASDFEGVMAHGLLATLAASFFFGLLVSLTPCVYPIISITVSVFGAKKATTRRGAWILSAVFVLGIVSFMVPVGVAAALSGQAFGSYLSNRWVIAGLAFIFCVLAASMFGAFDLELPYALRNRLGRRGNSGLLGAYSLGLVCGPIAAPCTGPFLAGMLTWIAKTGDATLGALSMSAFGFGLGTPFFLVGALAMSLPKSGLWMVRVKAAGGVILLVVALYFLGTAWPELSAWSTGSLFQRSALLALGVSGIALGAIHRGFNEGRPWLDIPRKSLAVTALTVALFGGISDLTKVERHLDWRVDSAGEYLSFDQALPLARKDKQPILVDFTARWCASCKEMDLSTFADPQVIAATQNWILVKVDATDDELPTVEAAMKRFEVLGLPTLLLLNPDGSIAQRFTEYVDAPRLLSALHEVEEQSSKP